MDIHPPSRPIDFDRERRWVLTVVLGLMVLLCSAGTYIISQDAKTVHGGAFVFAACAVLFASSLLLTLWRPCPLQVPIGLTVMGCSGLLLFRIVWVLSSEAVRSGELSAFNPIFGYVSIYFALLAVLLPPTWSVIVAVGFWLLIAVATTVLASDLNPDLVQALPALKLFVWMGYPMLIALIAGAVRIVAQMQQRADAVQRERDLARDELAIANRELEQRIQIRTRELEQEREALRAVLENVSEGIVACDPQGQMTVVNPAAQRLLGDPGTDSDASHWAKRLQARDDDGADTQNLPLWRALTGESVRDASVQVTLSDGQQLDLLVNASPITGRGPQPEGAVASFRDVSLQKQQRRDLERSNLALEQFAYAVSHDLQAPLRSVNGFAQLLVKRHADKLDHSGREYLEFISLGVGSMQAMIDGLLALSRLSSQAISLQRVSLDEVVAKAITHFEGSEALANAEIRIAPLPSLQADFALLITVFQNLLANALKFADGDAHIEIDAVQSDGMCRIQVRDLGVGFDPQQADELFRLFRRVGDTERFAGHGIGLCTCQRIIERLGGSISAHSDGPGLGATFTVQLPAAASAQAA